MSLSDSSFGDPRPNGRPPGPTPHAAEPAVPAGPPPAWSIPDLLALCLDTRCQPAWAEFIRRFQPLIAGVVGRIAARHARAGNAATEGALIDDLVQETYIRLCRQECRLLRTFRPAAENAFFGYLKVVAASVALDHFRGVTAGKRGQPTLSLDELDESRLTGIASPARSAARFESRLFQAELWTRLDTILEAERDRTLFRLYYQQGFTAREIAALPWVELTEKGVESLLARLVLRVRAALAPPRRPPTAAPAAVEGRPPEISF